MEKGEAMSRIMTGDLLDQFHRAIAMVRFTVEEFDDEQWLSGISWFQTPARVGYHLVETLDFYFSGKRDGQEFTYGHRFGGPWWEMEDAQLPGQEALLEYLDEVQARIEARFASVDDTELSAPFELYDWSGKTLLGHYAYALRHTMHHQGALSVLSTYHGHEGQNWA
jgi:uncharacterized damage-inducible protein DinB